MVIQVTGDSEFAAVEGSVAESIHTIFGNDFDSDKIPARTANNYFRVNNLHLYSSLEKRMSNFGFDLSGKTAVVIGATSGIGLTLAKGLAQAGANVVPTGRRAELVQSTSEEIRKLGRGSLAMPADVTDPASLKSLLNATSKEFGSVEILVNCAGRTKRTPSLAVERREGYEIMETNLTVTLLACQVFGRHMVERKYGRIINIASLSSFVSLFEVAAYSASKAAVASLTKSLAIEWARHGVCVNAIAPGVFR